MNVETAVTEVALGVTGTYQRPETEAHLALHVDPAWRKDRLEMAPSRAVNSSQRRDVREVNLEMA